MSHDPAPLVTAALGRLVGGDPLAEVLVAAAARQHPESFDAAAALALVAPDDAASRRRARDLARSRRERQHLAVVECWLDGDRDRARVLARDQLAEFPDDVMISWLTSRS